MQALAGRGALRIIRAFPLRPSEVQRFSWTAPRAGRYAFSTEGSTFDTILSIRRDGCSGTELVCNDDTLDLSSSVVVELDAGEPVTAIVDGFDGAEGAFSLGIHELVYSDLRQARAGADPAPELKERRG